MVSHPNGCTSTRRSSLPSIIGMHGSKGVHEFMVARSPQSSLAWPSACGVPCGGQDSCQAESERQATRCVARVPFQLSTSTTTPRPYMRSRGEGDRRKLPVCMRPLRWVGVGVGARRPVQHHKIKGGQGGFLFCAWPMGHGYCSWHCGHCTDRHRMHARTVRMYIYAETLPYTYGIYTDAGMAQWLLHRCRLAV